MTADVPPQFPSTSFFTLIDNGTDGSPHSGPVTASGDFLGRLSGKLQVVNNLIVVNLQTASVTAEVVFRSFIAPARNGSIGKGLFNNPEFAAVISVVFGKKGGC